MWVLVVSGVAVVLSFAAGWLWRGEVVAFERRAWQYKLARSESERAKLLTTFAKLRGSTKAMGELLDDMERTMV
ncbi:MAG: hypothetical protein E6Q76_02155 [Rhizobium sp.]|nr:MAG: hypothetical protein E6Q76_02155 [Rhizobium sp.]